MNTLIIDTDSIERVARQQHRQLTERHTTLQEKAAHRETVANPRHSAATTRAEADGVRIGVVALAEVIETINAYNNNRPD